MQMNRFRESSSFIDILDNATDDTIDTQMTQLV